MKKIIFGKSSVKEKDLIAFKCLMEQSKALQNAADEERANNDGNATVHGCWLLFRAWRLYIKAVRKLGFYNIDDFCQFLEKHGKL